MKGRKQDGTYLRGFFSKLLNLTENLLRDDSIVNYGEGEETTHVLGKHTGVETVDGPGFIDDLLQVGYQDCSERISRCLSPDM